MKNIILLLFVFTALGCKTKQGKQPDTTFMVPQEIPVIDLSKVTEEVESVPIKASELISGFDYVELEMTDSSVVETKFYRELGIPIFTSRYIYVSTRGRDLKFDRTSGKFIRSMGKIGRGPGEYISRYSRCVDESTGNYIVLSGYNGGIYIYDDDNRFIKNIKLPPNTYRGGYNFYYIYSIGCNKIMLTPSNISSTGNPYYDYMVMDLEKEEIYYKYLNEEMTLLNSKLKKPGEEGYYGLTNPLFWSYAGDHYFYLPFEDMIYKLDTLTGKGIPRYRINMGKYKSTPYYRASPDAPIPPRYELFFWRIVETTNYLIFRCVYSLNTTNNNAKFYFVLYNKLTGELVSREVSKTIENDFGGSHIHNFLPADGKNWWYPLGYHAVGKLTADRSRDELTPVGQREYDYFAGRDLEDINAIYRIMHLK